MTLLLLFLLLLIVDVAASLWGADTRRWRDDLELVNWTAGRYAGGQRRWW